MNDRHISIGEVAEILGISVVTLRRWDKAGKLCPTFRTLGKHRRYNLRSILKMTGKEITEKQGINVCYARVSSHDQKEDLVRQGNLLVQYCLIRHL